eukprot:143538_1
MADHVAEPDEDVALIEIASATASAVSADPEAQTPSPDAILEGADAQGNARKISAAQAVGPSTLFSHPAAQSDKQQTTTSKDIEDQTGSVSFLSEHKDTIKRYAKIIFVILWIAYSLAAFIIDFERARVLFIIEVAVIVIWILNTIYSKYCVGIPTKIVTKISSTKPLLYALYIVVILAVIAIIILCTYDDPGRLVAVVGLFVFVFGCYLFSWHRSHIKWRPVIWGLGLQFTFALIILRTEPGFHLFNWLGGAAKTLLDFTLVGSGFVFSYLATGNIDGTEPFARASVFAFSVIPTVIFFSSLVSILYYLGILQWVIYYLSITMQYTLGTSSSESLNAAGNIFVGMTEAPLLIKPFIENMTRSELHAVMTGGFATIAGGVMAIYIYYGVPASHLLTASVMSAPAALAISKIVYPEHEISPTAQRDEEEEKGTDKAAKVLEQIGHGNETNVIEAAANGASIAVGLAANIAGMLIAFLAIVALLDYLFATWGSLINWEITFTKLCGYIFYPFAIIMGIHPQDAVIAGELIGQKIVVNEFLAYLGLLGEINAEGGSTISDRSAIILIYALCGFSNFGSMGIMLGGLLQLAPSRAKDLTELVLSAMLAGNVACFMTACIAALLYDPERYT